MSDMANAPYICKNEYTTIGLRGIFVKADINGDAVIRDGSALQGTRGRDPAEDSGAASRRRGLRLRYPREPRHSAVQGVPSSGLPAEIGVGGDPSRRAVGSLPAWNIRGS